MQVERLGSGPRVVLVHGSATGPETWSRQRELAERWTLELVTRPGFWPLPPVPRVDFEADAPLVAEQLGEGAHLVGHSYGGVISLLAAAQRPEAVRSLTVVEPPALDVARGDPAVDAMIAHVQELWAGELPEPRVFLEEFLRAVGSTVPLPDELPPSLQRGAELLLVERLPHEARIPLEALRRGGFPVLVVSGAHAPTFDAVCDVLERELAAERAVVSGRGPCGPAGARLQRGARGVPAACRGNGEPSPEAVTGLRDESGRVADDALRTCSRSCMAASLRPFVARRAVRADRRRRVSLGQLAFRSSSLRFRRERVRELDDLEQVDDVDREGDRDEADRGGQRGSGRGATRRPRGTGRTASRAPRPRASRTRRTCQRRAPLREAAPQEAVVQVRRSAT